MVFDTKLKIGGNDFVTNRDTALKLYDLLANNAMQFTEYSNDMLIPLTEYYLQMSPLHPEFNDDVLAAKALGETFSEYYRNKQIKPN